MRRLTSEVLIALVVAVVLLSLFGVAAALYLAESAETERIILVLAFLSPTIVSLVVLIRQSIVEEAVNGTVTELAARSPATPENARLLDALAEKVRKGEL